MGADNSVNGGELELKKLEMGVNELIHTLDLLKQENAELRTQHTSLIADRVLLIEKTQQAQNRVVNIIQRLNTLEQEFES